MPVEGFRTEPYIHTHFFSTAESQQAEIKPLPIAPNASDVAEQIHNIYAAVVKDRQTKPNNNNNKT